MDFVPYHYGCYSFQAVSDLEVLQTSGWIEIAEKEIKLTKRLPLSGGLKKDEIEAMSRFMKSYKDYRGNKLFVDWIMKTVTKNTCQSQLLS